VGNTKVLHRNEEQDKEIEIFTEFDQMGLPDELLRGIYAWGLRRPTPVQQQAIVPPLDARERYNDKNEAWEGQIAYLLSGIDRRKATRMTFAT